MAAGLQLSHLSSCYLFIFVFICLFVCLFWGGIVSTCCLISCFAVAQHHVVAFFCIILLFLSFFLCSPFLHLISALLILHPSLLPLPSPPRPLPSSPGHSAFSVLSSSHSVGEFASALSPLGAHSKCSLTGPSLPLYLSLCLSAAFCPAPPSLCR